MGSGNTLPCKCTRYNQTGAALFLGFILAALIADRAARLAGALAGSLAFSASAVLDGFLKVSCCQCGNMLHDHSSYYQVGLIINVPEAFDKHQTFRTVLSACRCAAAADHIGKDDGASAKRRQHDHKIKHRIRHVAGLRVGRIRRPRGAGALRSGAAAPASRSGTALAAA